MPLAPSFDPFGLFGMTAVADLESLMGCRIIDTVRGEAGGVWYRRTGVWMRCPGEEKRRGGRTHRLYTGSEHDTREGTRLQL